MQNNIYLKTMFSSDISIYAERNYIFFINDVVDSSCGSTVAATVLDTSFGRGMDRPPRSSSQRIFEHRILSMSMEL